MLAGIVAAIICIAVVLIWPRLPRAAKWGVGLLVGLPFAVLILFAITPVFD